MPKVAYREKKFSRKRMVLIEHADDIIREYVADGYSLTLRQLYYQFVARGLLENNVKSYSMLGATINDARLCGLIDWNSIEDRTRNLKALGHWETPSDIITSAANSFHTDWWEGQDHYVEVWVEKEALAGVIQRPAQRWDVPWFCCRGYVSQSEMWRAAMRLRGHEEQGQRAIIIHLGDHDPSGIDMTRDIEDRLTEFGVDVTVNRIALTMAQVEEFTPPPNPAKATDTRFQTYVRDYGVNESWELDALEPSMLDDLISDTVRLYLDEPTFTAKKEAEEQHRKILTAVSDQWDAVVEHLREEDDE